MNNKTESMLAEHLFSQHEENFSHGSFDREIAFYESICTGDIEMVQMLASPLCSEGYGVLSNDPLRNIQYHLAISAAMIARFCVKSGMTPEEAYQLSDLYIMQADECKTVEEVHAVHAEMLKIYTRKMRYVHSGKAYSKQVINAIDYISEHLHGRIMLEEAAKTLGLSTAYLSRLFRTETGETFTAFANRKKIEYAANLLRYSKYTDLEISNLLCFSSQSYFIKIFKEIMHMTPKEYKRKYRIPEFVKNKETK